MHVRSFYVNPFKFWGASRVTSKLVVKYFITFVDDLSRVTCFFLMTKLFKLFLYFSCFLAEIETWFNLSVKILQSDRTKEYSFHSFNDFTSAYHIVHQSSFSYTP